MASASTPLSNVEFRDFSDELNKIISAYLGGNGSGNGGNIGNSGGNTQTPNSNKNQDGTKVGRFLRKTSGYLNLIDSAVRSIDKGITNMLRPWAEVDKAASKFSKSIAMSGAGMQKLRAQSIQLVRDKKLGALFNARPEDLIKIQQDYINKVGRSVMQNAEGLTNAAAMRAVMGGEKTEDFITKFEQFGLSMTESGKRAGQMFAKASKTGLSFEVYSQNFLDNIELAQKYTFKDGLRGLESMAKKATEVRLNMSQAEAFANKVNSLEGAIQTGAGLQVLGGPFAQFANPIQMLNESINDMEGLQDRIVNMFGNLGTFNKKTGETVISSFNKYRIREASERMGLDYGNIMQMIQRTGVMNEVEAQMRNTRNSAFNDKQFADLVKNVATIEEGRAGVNINGVFKELSELTVSDKKSIEAQRVSGDNIQDIAKTLRSWDDTIQGIKDQKDAIQASWVEKTGIGDLSKNLAKWIGTSNGLLSAILAAQAIGGVTGGLGRGADLFGKLKGTQFNYVGGKGGYMTLNNAKWSHGVGVGSNILGIGGLIGGGLLAYNGFKGFSNQNKARANGELVRGSKEDKKKTTWNALKSGAGVGLAAGSLITTLGAAGLVAGPIGAAIGGAAGLIAAGVINSKNAKIAQMKDDMNKSGRYNLKGDYKKSELEKLQIALKDYNISLSEFQQFDKKLQQKLIESGDVSQFSELQSLAIETNDSTIHANNVYLDGKIQKGKKAANGGLLVGPSHLGGGMPIQGTNIEVEGGEYVVNKRATKKNIGLLNSINRMGNGGIIKPRNYENGGAIPVMPSSRPDFSYSQSGAAPVKVEPITLNINGNIKLDGGDGSSINYDQLIKDPIFVQKLTKIMEESLNRSLHGGAYMVNRGFNNI